MYETARGRPAIRRPAIRRSATRRSATRRRFAAFGAVLVVLGTVTTAVGVGGIMAPVLPAAADNGYGPGVGPQAPTQHWGGAYVLTGVPGYAYCICPGSASPTELPTTPVDPGRLSRQRRLHATARWPRWPTSPSAIRAPAIDRLLGEHNGRRHRTDRLRVGRRDNAAGQPRPGGPRRSDHRLDHHLRRAVDDQPDNDAALGVDLHNQPQLLGDGHRAECHRGRGGRPAAHRPRRPAVRRQPGQQLRVAGPTTNAAGQVSFRLEHRRRSPLGRPSRRRT